MPRVSIRVGIAVLVAVCVSAAYANSITDIPSAQFIAAALKAQEVDCGPSLDVTYTHEFGGSSNRQTQNMRYIRTPDKLIAEYDIVGSVDVKVAYDRSTSQSMKLVKGKVKRSDGSSYDSNIGSVGGISFTPFLNQDFLETARYCIHEGPLCETIDKGSVRPAREDVDGFQCWCVDIPSTSKAIEKYVVWVDPEIGFCPRRVQIIWKELNPESVSFTDYKEVTPGVWFPMKQVLDHAADDGEPAHIVNTVTAIQVGKPIPVDELRVEFPSGTRVSVWHGKNAEVFTAP